MAQLFIDEFNASYNEAHLEFENQFWGTKMALTGDFSTALLTSTKTKMEALLMDQSKYEQTKKFLEAGGLTADEEKVLKIFKRTFECYIMPSEEAAKLREQTTALESDLEDKRNKLKLGYTVDGVYTEASTAKLRNTIRVNDDEAVRKASYEAIHGIGEFIVNNGFVEIVKQRNAMAKKLGFEDYYDYKVQGAEGFSKKVLFEIMDELEARTRPLMEAARQRIATELGETALLPWNTGYMMTGDVTKKLDPYFPFERAVEMWGRSFSAMNIGYMGATMNLDLLDRKHKYANGFCHWPQVAWIKPDGTFVPSVANFTSLADPKAVGSGHTALNTLMHEAGHAAHFANIVQRSPLFSQERAPTSVAYAENQSMFLDSLVGDARWRGRYARDRNDNPLPFEIHEEALRIKHPYEVLTLRHMIAVPYFEKALYEIPEAELTPAKILEVADQIEVLIKGGQSAGPLLSVPHIISDESSCYYHGYVLAEMSVHQTRKHFLDKYGVIVDNPQIGADLKEHYWKCGNSEMFLDLVKNLTGKPLSGDAWVEAMQIDIEELVKSERKDYDEAVAAGSPTKEGEVDLNMRMRLVDGDILLADSESGGFIQACREFEAKLQARIASSE